MEQKKINNIMLGLIYLVVFAAYSIVVFLIFREYNRIFWISYGFMTAAYGIHVFYMLRTIGNYDLKAVFFGMPFAVFSVLPVLAELAASVLFMVFRYRADVRITIVVQTLLLCVLIVAGISSVMAGNTARDVNAKGENDVTSMKRVQGDIELLLERSTDKEVTGALKKLCETVKYSDPVSSPAVMIQEQMIMQQLEAMRAAFEADEPIIVRELCAKIELLFHERNKILMNSK